MISDEVVQRQSSLLKRFGLPTYTSDADPEEVLKAMSLDKKTEDGSIKWVLLEQLGKAVVRKDVPSELVYETVHNLVGK